ncbi:MAG: hypothetical protein VX938_06610, partial [Myxococcota bacterium]|nr:hypothetical protein [Myxococcota bacterium]
MNTLRTIGVAATTLALMGCNASGWNADLTAEQLPESPPVPNSVAITLGPDSWPEASSELTSELSGVWPEGVVVQGGSSPIDSWEATLPESHLEWEELTVQLGVLTLTAGPEGLELRAEIAYDELPLMLQTSSYGACPVTIGMDQGSLSAMLTLSATKLGRIQANPMAEVDWWSEDMTVDLSSCPPELRL